MNEPYSKTLERIGSQIINERDTYKVIYESLKQLFLDQFGVMTIYHGHGAWYARTEDSIHISPNSTRTLKHLLQWCLDNRSDYGKEEEKLDG